MESFDRRRGGKKLPSKHGQQHLSAALLHPLKITQASEATKFSKLARLSLREGRAAPVWESRRGSFWVNRLAARLGRAARQTGLRGEPPVENSLLIGLSRV